MHHACLRPYIAQHLQQPGMSDGVEVQVAFWVVHRCGVTDLAGQIEDGVGFDQSAREDDEPFDVKITMVGRPT